MCNIWIFRPCAAADVASRQWIASLHQFSDGFTGIQNGFRPEYGPYGRMSNLRPTSQLPPPGLYSRASIPPHMESQSTLADGRTVFIVKGYCQVL